MEASPNPFEAESFELSGEGIQLRYVQTQGPRALRQMTLVLDDGERRYYQGADVHVDETVAGTLASVITSFAYDGDTVWLSVFLPGVNLSREPSAEITTVAVRTVHRGSIGGPQLIDGALSTSTAVALTGTASGGS